MIPEKLKSVTLLILITQHRKDPENFYILKYKILKLWLQVHVFLQNKVNLFTMIYKWNDYKLKKF